MVVTTVLVHVKPEHIEDFISATVRNHEGSIREPGNLRFDVLQSDDDPSKFMLYEAYESQQAAASHKETEHYKAWRQAVEPWMAAPRQGIKYSGIRP